MRVIRWTVKDIVNVLKERQANEFDGNIAVSGNRGDGKSTLIAKIFYRFKGFRPKKHQCYSREEIIYLLKKQQHSTCWDDEAINTGYKREFQLKGQQELIKILTTYRDNFNIFASAIPSFFSLDKDLRELYFIHLHVIERGLAVVHMPLQGKLYSLDRWDSKYNAKIEEGWAKRFKKNPRIKIPYHKLTTFRGYLYFEDLTEKQKVIYKSIKKEKRERSFTKQKEQTEIPFIDKIYLKLINFELTAKSLDKQVKKIPKLKLSSVRTQLGAMLKDGGMKFTLTYYLETTLRKKNTMGRKRKHKSITIPKKKKSIYVTTPKREKNQPISPSFNEEGAKETIKQPREEEEGSEGASELPGEVVVAVAQ